MQDFFHYTSTQKLTQIFQLKPFLFPAELSYLLADLTTFGSRLPMGSPTSPVLSNFSAFGLDLELTDFARREQITYTRFVDDMSFSKNSPAINELQLSEINEIIISHHFVVNPSKVKWFGPDDEKMITGLTLKNNRAEIPQKFFDQLEKDLLRLKSIYEVYYGIEKHGGGDWVDTFTKSVAGRINFVQYIHGKQSSEYKKLQKQFNANTEPADQFEVMQWLDMPYGF